MIFLIEKLLIGGLELFGIWRLLLYGLFNGIVVLLEVIGNMVVWDEDGFGGCLIVVFIGGGRGVCWIVDFFCELFLFFDCLEGFDFVDFLL